LPHQIIQKYVDSKFDPEVKRFLPASCMDELITSDAREGREGREREDELAHEDLDLREGPTISELVGFVLSKAKKVFAITILSGLRGKEIERAVFTFMRADFTDSSLPKFIQGKGNLSKFAIKQFMPPPDSKLEDEIDLIWEAEVSLLEEIRGLRHPNLTHGIAAIRRGRERYVMFPWADGGNLRDLWIDNPEPKVTAGLVHDIIEQLLGMAEALMRLHFRRDRHGDIKPENILVFPTGDKSCIGTLKLSGVGSVRDHFARTQLRSRNSGNSYGTVRYEPPESVTKKLSPRSRLSDIWSMGCVTVEFMVWLLYGYEELKEFNAHISGKLEEPSRFFVVDQIEDQGQQGTFPQLVANVHPAVQACIDHMSKDKECVGETALGDLLNIVKTKLLVV
ncbi:kinase-like domain-containing protein, partial [Leptodontidium sp. 2 PMI_412]